MLYQLMSNHPSNRAGQKAALKNSTKHQARKSRCNILENENEWTLDLLVPGFTKTDFTLDVKDGVLKISGNTEKDTRKFIKKEFGANQVERSFTLPKNAATEKILAKLEGGILSIVIPKNEQAKPKTIIIK